MVVEAVTYPRARARAMDFIFGRGRVALCGLGYKGAKGVYILSWHG